MGEMTKAERTELRQAVRLQYKVLRSEVAQRREEVRASLLQEVEERFDKDIELQQRIIEEIQALADDATEKAMTVLDKNGLQLSEGSLWRGKIIKVDYNLKFAEQRKASKVRVVDQNLDARVSAALTELNRQEAEMLRKLTLDGIESDAARSFFDAIPTVGALVPLSRLAELEASFEIKAGDPE